MLDRPLPSPSGRHKCYLVTRVRTKERQIEKTTRTDGDRGDEAHASFYSLGLYMCICSDMTAEPIDPGAYAAAPLASPPI